jgi:polysaccharide export outer membrane protein
MIDCSAIRASLAVGVLLGVVGTVSGQQPPAATPPPRPPAQAPSPDGTPPTRPPAQVPPPALPAGVTPPADYVIGAQDILTIVFWRDKDMNAEVTVRPDGKISLPLINEIQAAGLTPEQLRAKIAEAATKYIEDPTASVVVKEIRSRNVFITGAVSKPGTYPLVGDMNVLQLIALAGGLTEWADTKNIVVIQTENGKPKYSKFNYNDVIKQKHLEQNVLLKPNDTVVVQQ